MKKVVAMLSVIMGLSGCRFSPEDITTGEWHAYQISALGSSLRFELPAGGNLFKQPQSNTPEVGPDGFIGVYLLGFGFDRGTGLGSKVHFAMQIKQTVGNAELTKDAAALKKAVQAEGDALARLAGREPENRMNDFDEVTLAGRQWVSLVNPAGSSVSTYFDNQHYLSVFMTIAPKYKPSANARMALDKVLLQIASRVEIVNPDST